MNHFIFILKTVGISLLISSLLGILSGLFWSMKSPEHPHQMIPNWIIMLVLASFTSLLVGLIVGGTLSFLGKAHLIKAVLYTMGIVTTLLIAFLVYVMSV